LATVERISQMVRIISVRQKEPLGLGHAVLVARQAANDEPVAVLLGDDLFDCEGRRPAIGQLMDVYDKKSGGGTLALLEVEPGQEHLYGVVAGEPDGTELRVRDMVEKPAPGTAPSRLAVVGRYVLPSEIWPILEKTPPGKNGEIQLTDALKTLAQKGAGCYGLVVEGVRHDAGDKLGYLGACLSFALQREELRPSLLALMRRLLDEHT